MAIPNVLISDTESAPPSSTARAISQISVTLGESLQLEFYICFTNGACSLFAEWQFVPKAIPPCLTLGQEIFSSMLEYFQAHNSFSNSDIFFNGRT